MKTLERSKSTSGGRGLFPSFRPGPHFISSIDEVHGLVDAVASQGSFAFDVETVGVLAHPGQVDVRIAARAVNEAAAQELIAPIEVEVRQLLVDNIFGEDDETIESVVGTLLEQRGLTISTYEDLSGGAVADAIQSALL